MFLWRAVDDERPYLLGAPDARVAERFHHIFMNVMKLGPDGRVQPVSHMETTEYYRMPTDFEANAALVIRDPGLFKQRLNLDRFGRASGLGISGRASDLL